MNRLKSVRTIFFDYDGTLHNSIKIYGPAFQKAYKYLVENGYANDRTWQEEEITYWLGFNNVEMWKGFMPQLEENIRDKCIHIIGNEMREQIKNKKAELYDDALEILKYLKSKGYNLIFISNCNTYYKNTHKDLFNLGEYFDLLVGAEEYAYIPKHEILTQIMPKFPKEMIIIGDRKHDMEAGKINGIYTIGCNYGFAQPGELKNADFTINKLADLYQLL